MEHNIRTIEETVDSYHLDLQIFKHNIDVSIVHLLRAFEDGVRLSWEAFTLEQIISGNTDEKDIILNHYLDGLNQTLRWIKEVNNKIGTFPDLSYHGEIYLDGITALLRAIDYTWIEDSYILLSKGKTKEEIHSNSKEISFEFTDKKYVDILAADLVLTQDTKQAKLIEGLNKALPNKPDLNLLKESLIQDENNIINYNIPNKIWVDYYKISQIQIEVNSDLPPDWIINNIKLSDYKEVWLIILTIATIHQSACSLSTRTGAGIESIILLISQDELITEINKHTSLEFETINKIISLYIYDSSLQNGHITWQPLVKLKSNIIAISPTLIMHNNFERNLISLLNKKFPKEYSILSTFKEDIMLESLSTFLNSFKNLKFNISIKLPAPEPDIDLIIYDTITESLILIEVKWLLSADSIKEIFSRENDLNKGLSQAEKIYRYTNNNMNDVLLRAFNDSSLKVSKVYSCVLSKNNIFNSSTITNFKIINEHTFLQLIQTHNANISKIIDIIKNEHYLPKKDVDYILKETPVNYAGYKWNIPTFSINDIDIRDKSDFKCKNLNRNDKCPNKKNNPISGQILKYKNCCGKNS